MKAKHVYGGTVRLLMIFTLLVSLTHSSLAVGTAVPTSTSDSYHYIFDIHEDGFTDVVVDYEGTGEGSSWVFVPRFSNWSKSVSAGRILQSRLVETEDMVGVDYYFYQAFNFYYTSDGGDFNLKIQFNMSVGAFIIEPRGMFFSPQIGFKEGSNGEAEVLLPSGYEIDESKCLAIGQLNHEPRKVYRNYAFFDLPENLIRLQIEFSTNLTKPDLVKLQQGVFTFDAVKRYESYANEILNFYNAVYSDLVDLFNVTLENVNTKFFIPDFYTFLSIGGYVPFTREEIGDIHLNIFFERTVKGVLEVFALHELIHQFLWETGLSPDDFLWFHEGVAQYVSIEVVDDLGYEGASTERSRLEDAALQVSTATGGKFSRLRPPLQEWNPASPPANIGAYYAASYHVVSRLAEDDGLDYYSRFFKTISGTRIENIDILTYHLSIAANETVAPTLRGWGFDVADLYTSSTLIEEARKRIEGLNPMFQPYKSLAETFYEQGLVSLEEGYTRRGNRYLKIAIFLAEWAPLLTLITWTAILVAIVYIFRRRRVPPKPEIPAINAAFEQRFIQL